MYVFFTAKLRNRHYSLSCLFDLHSTAEKLSVLDVPQKVINAQQDRVLVLWLSQKERVLSTARSGLKGYFVFLQKEFF